MPWECAEHQVPDCFRCVTSLLLCHPACGWIAFNGEMGAYNDRGWGSRGWHSERGGHPSPCQIKSQ